jgi:hypothetical protein
MKLINFIPHPKKKTTRPKVGKINKRVKGKGGYCSR